MKDIKSRMSDIDVTQVEMILELKKRGYTVQPPEMSSMLRGTYTGPKANKILKECDAILTEHESSN